jgi:uncharacterized membrane protein YbhN (UPF0104 family)
MITLAACVVFAGNSRFASLRWAVLSGLLGLIAAVYLFRDARLRRLVRFERLVQRLPQGERLLKLDRALADHVRHPAEMLLAFLLSLGNHLFVAAQVYVIGHAFGDRLGAADYLGVVTIAHTVSSLPTTPGGIGIGEAAYGSLFTLLGAAGSLGVATCITYRLTSAALSLLGGLFLLLPAGGGARAELARVEREGDPAAEDSALAEGSQQPVPREAARDRGVDG